MAQSKNTLKWRFDVNTFRLLGRDLITDRITALFELVKNSYDANADNVTIQFLNVSTHNQNSKIIIADNGIGMSLKDIEDKWMVIGTNSKRKSLYSPEPYNRRYVGEKGIGRFAVDKLGQYVKIRTRQENDEKELVVTINWETYQNLAEQEQLELKLFTEIENEYEWVEPTFEKGTVLEIMYPRDIWELKDINMAYKELSHLVSPFDTSKYPFTISIYAPEFEPYIEVKPVKTDEQSFASYYFELSFNEETKQQETLRFDKIIKKVLVENIPMPSFGFIKFRLYYFDEDAKSRFKAHYKGTDIKIDGIKLYRDGILTTPFAELEGETLRRRDVLGIDKRRRSDIFYKISSSDIIGHVEITKDGNPKITDVTNRQDFNNTPEYNDLKNFIYLQLDSFTETRKIEKNEKTKEKLSVFDATKNIVNALKKDLQSLSTAPTQKKKEQIVNTIVNNFDLIQKGVTSITEEYQETKKEEERKEKMYFSLMSLSLFAANVSHAVRTIIYSIKDDASYLQNKVEEEKLKIKSMRINREIGRLLKVVDFMLKYAKTDLPSEYFSVQEAIMTVFDAHETIFLQKHIRTDVEIEANISLHGNPVFFQDIITNLISNSIKAVEGNLEKRITCKANSTNKDIQILFSDNGIGIPDSKREWVFGMYNTTTQEQGGAGIGLYVVKTNVEALAGHIEIIDNKVDNSGVTFNIIIPFKK